MRIGIDARELGGRATGVGRYLGGLLHEWAGRRRDAAPHEFVLYAPEPIALSLDARRFATRTIAGRRRHVVGAGAAAARGARPIISTSGSRPPTPRRFASALPTVVAIHDLSFVAHPEWFRLREGVRRRWLTQQSAQPRARGDHDFGVLEARADRAPRRRRRRRFT